MPTRRPSLRRRNFLALALAAARIRATRAQTPPERFWLAGRYDGNRVVVYFRAVRFQHTVPAAARKLPIPVTTDFFGPVELPAGYLARFQKTGDGDSFALGDRYDLLLDTGDIATVTLTTLVGFESDEDVGNDSYIGAIATIEKGRENWLSFNRNYFVLRRHRGPVANLPLLRARLLEDPIRFDLQTRMVELLSSRVKAADAKLSPSFAVQQFRLADGSLRYYARAEWRPPDAPKGARAAALAGWIAPLPQLRILATESAAGFQHLPELLNVVALSDGRAALVLRVTGEEYVGLRLVEYRDGADWNHMRLMQSTGVGE